MTKYLCAITLPVPVALALREIQENYKSSSWGIMIEPHITIVPPGAALATPEQAEEMLRKVVATTTPFDITVRGVGSFQNAANTIFAKVEPSEELLLLQQAVYQVSSGFVCNPKFKFKFHPHITLSNKLNSTLAQQILDQLEGQRMDFTFRCDNLTLFKKEPGDLLWSESKRLSF